MMANDEKRELRVLNRNFSLGEYGESWTKLEWYLFIEIYNVIKEFYLAKSSKNIETFSSESIMLTLPIDKLDKKLFKGKHRKRDLEVTAEGLSKKRINLKKSSKEHGFDFITIFPRITYDPDNDKKNIYVKIQSDVYEKMVPIESYCQLDLELISEFNSGNTVRLYGIFKSYAFRSSFVISFNELRKKMGFHQEGNYKEWKYFNAKVLKPAVKDINGYKEYDIEVFYNKPKGLEDIEFKIKIHKKQLTGAIQVLNLNETIDENHRTLNLIQKKFIETFILNCEKIKVITNTEELTHWIITDLIMQQKKQEGDFDFKHSMNAIGMQLRENIYTQPYSHQKIVKEVVFDPVIYEEIKDMMVKNRHREIAAKYTDEQIKVNHFDFLLEELKQYKQ